MSNRHLGKEALRSVARSSCHPGSEMGPNCPMEKGPWLARVGVAGM